MPFASWIPKPAVLILILVMLMPLIAVSGVYTSNASDISGALATYNEFVTLAGNATAIGSSLAVLIMMRIKMRFRSKEIMVGGAVALALLSYINGTTDNPYVIVTVSFLIGFVKLFAMTEMVLPIMVMLAPAGHKGKFYAIFYPLLICAGQLSSYYFALAIFNSNYQSPYYIMTILMLFVAVISILFQHNNRFCFKVPLYQLDWISLFLLGISAMSFNVCLTFMKQQGWFVSPFISGSLSLGFLFFVLAAYRIKKGRRKLIDLDIFIKKDNVRHSIILLIFLGIFISSVSVYSQYTAGVLGFNNLIIAKTNLWMVPGVILASIIAIISFKNKWKIKLFITAGFISFFIHTLCLYLLIQPQMNIEYLEYSMIFKGLGMGMLFIGISYYASVDLLGDDVFAVISVLLILRSFLGTAIGGAIIGYLSYQGQWQSLNDISMYLDNGSISNGMEIYQNINVNAVMASAKIVFGVLCWMIFPVLIFVWTHHYGEFNYRRLVFLRRAVRGNSMRGYRFFKLR